MMRTPAVAGYFYPGDRETLRTTLSTLVPLSDTKKTAKGIIVPHAGLVYSGEIAGKLYGEVEIPATVLIIGPNHHGSGAPIALFPEGEWQTPLGNTPINSRLTGLLNHFLPGSQLDTQAHASEHSLELQLLFLQYLRPDVEIAAICLGYGDVEVVELLGNGIASALNDFREPVLMVASSDMSHYESAAQAHQKDQHALDRILAMDPAGLVNVCRRERITMCGVIPAAVLLVAAMAQGATMSQLVAYGTSGDVTGDSSQVVGYAAVMVE